MKVAVPVITTQFTYQTLTLSINIFKVRNDVR